MIAGGKEGLASSRVGSTGGWDCSTLPVALLDAFKGEHQGYFYLLAVYFTFLRIPSQLSAAALSRCAGAMTAVFAYASPTASLRTGSPGTWAG